MYNIMYDDGALENDVLQSSVKVTKTQRAANLKRNRAVSPTI